MCENGNSFLPHRTFPMNLCQMLQKHQTVGLGSANLAMLLITVKELIPIAMAAAAWGLLGQVPGCAVDVITRDGSKVL